MDLDLNVRAGALANATHPGESANAALARALNGSDVPPSRATGARRGAIQSSHANTGAPRRVGTTGGRSGVISTAGTTQGLASHSTTTATSAAGANSQANAAAPTTVIRGPPPPPRFPMARAAAGPASNTNAGAGTGASPNDDGGRPQFQARVTPSQEGLAACRALRDYNSQVATWIQDTFNMSLIQIRDTIIEGNGCFSVKTMSDYNQFQSWASKTGLVPREPGEDVNEHNRTIACYWDSLRDDEMVEVMEKVKAWNCENAKGMSKDKTKAAVSRLQKRVLRVTTEAEDLWGISMVSFIAS
ncbi:unnamed protein product, partial [Tilletia caries]